MVLGGGKNKRKKEKHYCQTKSSLDSRMSRFNCQTFEAILNLFPFAFFNIFRNSICITLSRNLIGRLKAKFD